MTSQYAMPEISMPTRYLNQASGIDKDIWERIDQFRARPPKGIQKWDPRVFLPLNGWMAFIRSLWPNISDKRRYSLALHLSTVGAWRPAQDIYHFDSELLRGLAHAPIDGLLPVSELEHLPAWCIFFSTGPMLVNKCETDGFFASLEQDDFRKRLFLRLLFMGDKTGLLLPVLIPFGNWSLERAIYLANDLNVRVLKKNNSPVNESELPYVDAGLKTAMNMVRFACERGSESSCSSAFPSSSQRATYGGWRILPPAAPRISFVGGEGGKGRDVKSGGLPKKTSRRSSPSPHIRQGHLHRYWKGPKMGNGYWR